MDKIIVKRIVGMPGETVSYTRRGGFWEGAPVTVHVPPGHIFLQGDNPADSVDSRDYGPVPLALVKGRVMFKVGRARTCFPIGLMASCRSCGRSTKWAHSVERWTLPVIHLLPNNSRQPPSHYL